jgi:hypothetical protein
MAAMLRSLFFAAALSISAALAAGVDCPCDPANPETMKLRQCSLCELAEQQPLEPAVFFVKDKSPMKPNRWLALPRKHGKGDHPLDDMTPAERTELWTAAIDKAKSLWGDDWGVAYNGGQVRTQCHTHIHIGKILPLRLIDTGNFIVVRGPADIPSPKGAGMWIHAVDGKLHVHMPEQRAETVLYR